MLKAPDSDLILEIFSNAGNIKIKSLVLYDLILEIYATVKPIKPQTEYKDIIREIYITADRGSIKDFGNYKEYRDEEIVENYNDFLQLYKDTYPEKVKWYKIIFVEYSKNIYISVDSKIQISIEITGKDYEITGLSIDNEHSRKLLQWIHSGIKKEVSALKKNPEAYNKYIQEKLSYRKRTGKIKRITFWEGISSIERLDKLLGKEIISDFEAYIASYDANRFITEMSANDFYRYCEICYDANDYFKNIENKLTSKEKYLKMADGRDESLRNIEENSREAFNNWYKNKSSGGGHPWEICRGGNSTHISLFVHKYDKGFQLRLAGSSRVRVAETVRMAVALAEKKIPFILSDANEILRMIKGTDYIGIVPENVLPRYCHSFFPAEDKIIDFMNPWHDKEIYEFIEKNAVWYKIKIIELI